MAVKSEVRSGWATAALTAACTLAGAALGVAGTIFVGERTLAASDAAATLEVRRETYFHYLDATDDYFNENLSFYLAREEHCAMEVTIGDGDKSCAAWNPSPELAEAREEWITVTRKIRLYGSDLMSEQVAVITEALSPVQFQLVPWGSVATNYDPLAEGENGQSDHLIKYLEAFDRVDQLACTELAPRDIDCRERSS